MASTLRTPAAGALGLLLAINLFNYIDRSVLAAVEPKIAEAFFAPGDPDAMAKTGSLATAFLLSYMLLAPVFGWLADRFSRWVLIGCSVALWSLASGWSGLAGSFAVLVLTRVLVGVGEAGYGPAAPTIIADLYPVERRGSVLSLFYLAIPVGSALGYILGGLSAEHLGWRWAFYLVVPPGLLLAGLCFLRKDTHRATSTLEAPQRHANLPAAAGGAGLGAIAALRAKAGDALRTYRNLFRIRSYVLNTAAMTAMTFAAGGMSFWIPRYIYQDRAADFPGGPSLNQINLTFGIIAATAGLLATLLGGYISDRVRRRRPGAYFLVSGIAILLAFPAVVLMLRVPFPAAWALIFIAVFFLFFNTGPSNAALANVTKPAVRASAYALNIFVIHALGDAISPPLMGWIGGRWGLGTAFLLVSAMIVVSGLCWLAGAPGLAKDVAAAQDESPAG